MKVVLITGGAGFIGSNLALKLVEKGYQVKVLDRKRMSNMEIAKMLNTKEFRIMKTKELTRYYTEKEILSLIIRLSEIDLKIKMLECHESQVKWIKDHDDVDLIEEALTISRFRGLQCNCKYAEAFTQELVFPKIVAKRLLP